MRLIARIVFRLVAVTAAAGLLGAAAVGVFVWSLLPDLPSIETIRDIRLKVPLRIHTADGALIGEFGDERRIPVQIDNVPPLLVNAILAAEDDAFYRHPGVDIAGVARAAIANLRSGEHGQGASTITMQVARNYFLTREKTYKRKIKETLLAFRLEQALTKDEILELYINKIFLGHRAYGFGAAARVYYAKTVDELTLAQIAMLAGLPKAPSRDNPLTNPDNARVRRDYVLSRLYDLGHIDAATFEESRSAPLTASRHVAEVDVEAPYVTEMARRYMVERYGEQAYERGYRVYTTIQAEYQRAADAALRRGLIAYDRRHGYRGPVQHVTLSKDADREWLASVVGDVPPSNDLLPAVVIAVGDGHFKAYTRAGQVVQVDASGFAWARRHLSARKLGPQPDAAGDVVAPGDVIYVQPIAENGWRLAQIPEAAGALVSLRPADGAILALTGGFDYYLTKFNRATQAKRQPGSNLKPFIYSAALEKGFTPATLVSGAPIVVEDTSTEAIWRPENYSKRFFGPTRLRHALSLSLNLVSVRLLRAIGVEHAINHLERFGFYREQLPQGLSLALGAASLTPLEIVSGYAVFANGGYRVEPYLVATVEDRDGAVVERTVPATVCGSCPNEVDEASSTRHAERVISAENVFLMNSLMQQVISSGTGRRALQLARKDLAGKTGTTNNYHDAWFSGFNGDVVTTVWVGFDQPSDLGRGEAGSRAALPIWIDFMKVALQGRPEKTLAPPDSIVSTFVHSATGEAVSASHPDAYEEYFVAGTEPLPTATAAAYSPATEAVGRTEPPRDVTEGLF